MILGQINLATPAISVNNAFMKINKLLVVITIIAIANLGYSQQGGKTKGYKLTHLSYGNVVFSKGAFQARFNLRALSYGCVQATPQMLLDDKRECMVRDKATYKLIDAVEKGGKYYLLIINESPSGNGGCDACRRCGADGSLGLIWVEVGANKRLGKKQSIPLADCDTFSSTIDKNGDDIASEIIFAGDVAEFRTKTNVYNEKDIHSELTDWRYDRRSPEKGIVALKKEKKE